MSHYGRNLSANGGYLHYLLSNLQFRRGALRRDRERSFYVEVYIACSLSTLSNARFHLSERAGAVAILGSERQ